MNNRVLILIAACLAFYFAWLHFGRQMGLLPERVEEPPLVTQEVSPAQEPAPSSAQRGVEPASEGVEPGADAPLELEPKPDIPHQEVVFQNGSMEVRFSNQGAVIREVILHEYLVSPQESERVSLVEPRQFWPAEILLPGVGSTSGWMFHVEQPTPQVVEFRSQHGPYELYKRFELGPSYDLRAHVEVTSDNVPVDFHMVVADGLQPVTAEDQKPRSFLMAASPKPKLTKVEWSTNQSHHEELTEKLEQTEFQPVEEPDVSVDWAGIGDIYFANVFIPDQPMTGLRVRSASTQIDGESLKSGVVAFATRENLQGEFYFGPKLEDVIDQVQDRAKNLVSYGIAGTLSRWLYKLLRGIHAMTGNWGWAIVLTTLVIRLALLPLTIPSMRSSFRMKELQPKIDAIRKKYPGKDMESRNKMSQETMKLYKEEGVNPFSSCITMLPQLPVFLAYFSLLRVSIALRHSEWIWWVKDLSISDPTLILPILMGASMYLTQLTMPIPGDPAQQKMMKLMPVMLSVMFLFMPAGLILYMITSNVFQLGQTYFMKWRFKDS